jgi:sulfate adenylyltransferase subunit 1
MITKENNCPEPTQNLNVILTWMNEKPLVNGSKLFLKHTCQEVKAIVTEIVYEIDINTLHRKENTSKLEMNLIGKVKIRTSKPIFVDRYDRNRSTGSIILIDPQNNNTLAAGIIL